MKDFNIIQVKNLLQKENITLVYLHASGDYWIRQEEFCNNFRAVPLTDEIVIHVQFEGLSLTHSLVVPAVEKIIEETGRDPKSVYVFSPNAMITDTSWTNLFWKIFRISDEFTRSETYWCDTAPVLEDNFKTWALFVGRRTTPRLLALYDIWQDLDLQQKCLLSIMNHPAPESIQIFDRPEMIYDQLDSWLPVENKIERMLKHHNFRSFCNNLPFGSIDGYSLTDQYVDKKYGDNRSNNPSTSLINLGSKYLFEITFETMTRGFTFTPSEKTVRTIVAEKPLIVYAPANFLKNMQKIGFRTFGNLWDESYDQLEGPARYKAIMRIVKEISTMSRDSQLELYNKSRVICAHNKELLKQYSINSKIDPMLNIFYKNIPRRFLIDNINKD